MVKELREKEEAAGRVREGLARKACREFPLVFLFENQNPLTNWLITTSENPLNGLQRKFTHSLIVGQRHRRTLKKGFEEFRWVRDPKNTFFNLKTMIKVISKITLIELDPGQTLSWGMGGAGIEQGVSPSTVHDMIQLMA